MIVTLRSRFGCSAVPVPSLNLILILSRPAAPPSRQHPFPFLPNSLGAPLWPADGRGGHPCTTRGQRCTLPEPKVFTSEPAGSRCELSASGETGGRGRGGGTYLAEVFAVSCVRSRAAAGGSLGNRPGNQTATSGMRAGTFLLSALLLVSSMSDG